MTTATIEIADHISSPAICSLYYMLDYRLSGEDAWQSVFPNPIPAEGENTVQIDGLQDDSTYECRIKRVCCDGSTESDYTLFEINT